MLVLALVVVAATATTAAAVILRRRRGASRGPLSARRDPLPAGVHHLASSVSDLSDLGLHLHAARRSGKPRLGAVLQPSR